MDDIILQILQIVFRCITLLFLIDIRRYLRSLDSGQEETNEYLSDIRKICRESMEGKKN